MTGHVIVTSESAWLTPGERMSTLNLMTNSSSEEEPASLRASLNALTTIGRPVTWKKKILEEPLFYVRMHFSFKESLGC